MTEEKVYSLREGSKTLKQFFDRFYCIPKEDNYTKEQLEFLKANAIYPTDESVRSGKNGYITFRGTKPKRFTEEQCKEIRESNLTQMELSKKYNCSVGTINKIKNNKY